MARDKIMIYLINVSLNKYIVTVIGAVAAFVLTYFLLKADFAFLPKDHGRAFAVDGEKSKGKTRGVGIIMILSLMVVSILFMPMNPEAAIYLAIIVLCMISGYLDDAAAEAWTDYKKGAIDLVLSIAMVVTFIHYNSTDIHLLGYQLHINPIIYGILGVILIWVSINVTNCSDGVDGLCASVAVVELSAFVIIFRNTLGSYNCMTIFFIEVLIAYLIFNWSPSTMLMGDAGSRAIGIYIALIAMKSGHPFIFIILSLVYIIDGGTGLVKVFLKRFLHINFMMSIVCPIHDHLRKQKGLANVTTVYVMIISEAICAVVALLIMLLAHVS